MNYSSIPYGRNALEVVVRLRITDNVTQMQMPIIVVPMTFST
jgi:hypothetical protein